MKGSASSLGLNKVTYQITVKIGCQLKCWLNKLKAEAKLIKRNQLKWITSNNWTVYALDYGIKVNQESDWIWMD